MPRCKLLPSLWGWVATPREVLASCSRVTLRWTGSLLQHQQWCRHRDFVEEETESGRTRSYELLCIPTLIDELSVVFKKYKWLKRVSSAGRLDSAFASKRSQLRWCRHLIRMPLYLLCLEVFLASPTERRPRTWGIIYPICMKNAFGSPRMDGWFNKEKIEFGRCLFVFFRILRKWVWEYYLSCNFGFKAGVKLNAKRVWSTCHS